MIKSNIPGFLVGIFFFVGIVFASSAPAESEKMGSDNIKDSSNTTLTETTGGGTNRPPASKSSIYSVDGRVAIATTATGSTSITSNGIRFPDGTTQTTAASSSSPWSQSTGGNIYYSNGKVGIATTNPTYTLHVNGDAAGTSWTNLSSREYKENIRSVDETALSMMLAKLMDMDLTTYAYKKECGGDGDKRIGFIAEDMPEEVLSKDGKGVDLYELLTFTIGAMKAQQKRIEELETLNSKFSEVIKRLEKLEK